MKEEIQDKFFKNGVSRIKVGTIHFIEALKKRF